MVKLTTPCLQQGHLNFFSTSWQFPGKILGWTKSLLRFFHNSSQKNWNELFGQPNIRLCIPSLVLKKFQGWSHALYTSRQIYIKLHMLNMPMSISVWGCCFVRYTAQLWCISSQPGTEPGAWYWKPRILSTRPPGNSHPRVFLNVEHLTWFISLS